MRNQMYTRVLAGDDLPENEFIITMTSDSPDRHGTVVDPDTLKTDNYRKNPVLLYQHEMRSMPIGKTIDFWRESDGRSVAHVRIDGDTELERLLIKKLNKGSVNAASIGFDASEARLERMEDGYILIRHAELIELSIVAVGSNPDALVESRELVQDHEDQKNVVREKEKYSMKDIYDEMKKIHEKIDKIDKKLKKYDDKKSHDCTNINIDEDIEDLYRELIDYRKEKREEDAFQISDLSFEDLEF